MEDSLILYDRDIQVENGKIQMIGKGLSSANSKIVDASGKFVCPGLIDLHVHLFDSSELLTYLSYGVTTVLNMDGGSTDYLQWKKSVDQQKIIGSRMFTAGCTLDGVPQLNWMFWGLETPEQARRAVAYQKQKGYDYIKIYGTLNPDVFEALQKEASVRHITVVGHVPRQVGVLNAVTKNYKLIAHGEDLIESYFSELPSDAALDSLVKELSNYEITITPNLCIHRRMLNEINDLRALLNEATNKEVYPAVYSQWIRSNNRSLDQYDLEGFKKFLQQIHQLNLKLTAALKKYHIRTALGTDAAVIGYPGVSVIDELREFKNAGYSNYEALKTATANGGEFLNETLFKTSQTGKIKKGYAADLLILDKNPLEDIENIRSFQFVILNGISYSKQELETKKQSRYKNYPRWQQQTELIDSLFENGQTANAIKKLKECSEQYPVMHLFSQWVLGIKAMRAEQKDPHDFADVQKANLQFYPHHFANYNKLSEAYFANHQLDSAKKYAMLSLQMAPANAIAVNLFNKIDAASKKFEPVLNGKYLVIRFNKNLQAEDSIQLTITANELKNGYTINYIKTEQTINATSIIGNSDQVWFNVQGNFGDMEYFMDKKTLTGRWKAPFGNNGSLKIIPLH